MLEIVMEWEGETYRYQPEAIGTAEAAIVKERTGMGLKTMSREIDDMNPNAVQALFYLMKCQNAQGAGTPLYSAVDVKYPVKFMNLFNTKMVEAMEEDAKKIRAAASAAESPSTPTPTSATSEG